MIRLTDEQRDRTMSMVEAIHKFAQETDCPPGENVIKWFDHMWDRVIQDAKLLKERGHDW